MPSAAPLAEALECVMSWKAAGYQTAVARELNDELTQVVDLHTSPAPYLGYASTINDLARRVMDLDSACDVVVAGSDDVRPDQTKRAPQIASEFIDYFKGTLGVLQPGGHHDWSINATWIAWSPWLGREWIRRAYGGRGPLWPEYKHLFVDAELAKVAKLHGCYWWRSDLTHTHLTWKRRVPRLDRPAHLMHIVDEGPHDRKLYNWRQEHAWPDSELAT